MPIQQSDLIAAAGRLIREDDLVTPVASVVADESAEERMNRINAGFNAAFRTSAAMTQPAPSMWIVETHDDYVIASEADKYFRVGMIDNGSDASFETRDKWIEVVKRVEWDAVKAMLQAGGAWQDALKVGARNSGADQGRLQIIHDYAKENGAACSPETTGGKSVTLDPDSMIAFGDAVKALDLGDGKVKVTGHLIRFGSPTDHDLSETHDFFDKKTDYAIDFPGRSHTWFNHRLPVSTKRGPVTIQDRFEPASLSIDDVGVLFEGILDERKTYDAMLIKLARAGKLGLSSGTASHLVKRTQVGNANHIDQWPLGLDASYTHTPAEHRNSAVVSLKSLTTLPIELDDVPEAAQESGSAHSQAAPGTNLKTIQNQPQENTMNDEQTTALTAQIKTLGDQVAALQTIIATAPPIKTVGTGVQVVVDEADRPFKSIAEQCSAIKRLATSYGRVIDPRLTNPAIKALSGAGEGSQSDGGYLLNPTLTAEFLEPTHVPGQFSAGVTRLPVSIDSNSGWINGVNETSRASGSRWGGIQGYRLAEGGTPAASKPKFRRVNWELKKYGLFVYGSDELLADAAQWSTIVRKGCAEEIDFMLNEDIFEGSGAAGPHGLMQSGACISVAKETNQAADTVVYENLVKMWSRLTPRSESKAAWYINSEVKPQLHTMAQAVGTAALPPRFVEYTNGAIAIFGRPVYTTEFNAAIGDLGDIVLADMSEYLMWEKGGVQEARSIEVAFLTDETFFRFIYRVDGQTALAKPLTPNKGTATLSPFITLAAR